MEMLAKRNRILIGPGRPAGGRMKRRWEDCEK